MKNNLLRLVYHLLRLTRPRLPAGAPTILVLQYQMPLGCCVHGTPIFAALKAAQPTATILVATRGLGAAVLQHDPHIDHILITGDPTPSLAAKWRVAQQLRAELRARNLHPTLIVQDASSKAGSFALFAALLRLAPTTGFANAPALYDRHIAYDWDRSLIDNNLRLADAPHIEPAVYFTAAELATARALLAEANPSNRPLTAFVLQGSGGQRTGWHDDRFAAVIRHAESLGHQVLFLGTAADTPTIDRIRTLAASSGVSLAGRTTIPQLAAVLCLCDLLITLDTGTLHVGRAAALPTVVLGPSWQKPLEWLPIYQPHVRILRGPDQPTVPPHYQLDEITVPAVTAAIDDLQLLYPPSPTAREDRTTRLLSTTRPRRNCIVGQRKRRVGRGRKGHAEVLCKTSATSAPPRSLLTLPPAHPAT
jgi:ADP-heptose:LPS heptosyltransferase